MCEEVPYGYQKVSPSEKRRLILGHFDTIARRYDLADTLLSFGLHLFWRRRVLQRLGLKQGDQVLDLCTGTADFAVMAAKAVGPTGRVVAVDISREMMAAGQLKASRAGLGERIRWIQGDAECMGFAANCFDVVIIGYGIRNFVFLERGIREIHRVLRHGAKFMAMEFSVPCKTWLRDGYHFYSFRIMPRVGQLIAGTAAPFHYLAESIRVFPSPDAVQALLAANGFGNVTFERLTQGLAVLYAARKQ